MASVRVRFAPSPTGNLHLGTLRTALFSWLYAQHHQGVFVLRIEDTDLQRSESYYEHSIFEGLAWLGLDVEEGPELDGVYAPYRQSERAALGLYQAAADQLLEKKMAYYCFCTTEELAAERALAETEGRPYVYSRKALELSEEEIAAKLAAGEPYVIRFKMPANQIITFHDVIRGDISFDSALISDFVLLKSDGTPSYNFACAVDDSAMEITHVIRGEDHISNTPKQLVLYDALGVTVPAFAHLPMILGPDKSKLSKRHGATSVTEYREAGYLPEALFNYMSLLGWSSPDAREIMTRDEIKALFTLERVSKSGAVFDVVKLKWMNGQYIRKLDKTALWDAVKPFISEGTLASLSARYSPDVCEDIIFSVRDNLDVLTDIEQYISVYIDSADTYKEKVLALEFSESDRQVLALFLEHLRTLPGGLSPVDVDRILELILEQTGFGKGKVFKPIRLACSGYPSGPHLPELLSILGKDLLIQRC
ncbi:MAG: glutamate--tRNA ligase [Candidatus Margulisbacteria bacterium]|nr:glutamate--tRNA ligase [Candidatus Margulisiibacteriota bacterium]